MARYAMVRLGMERFGMALSLYDLVGMQYRGMTDFVRSLPAGEPLTLVRDPTNEYDPNAVQVWARGQHIGFCKATQARALAQKMDAADVATTFVGKLIPGNWPQIEVEE